MAKKLQLADLAPNPKNPRRITDKKLAMLGESLRRFGDLGGVVFNRRSQTLVSGHQRVTSAKAMKAGLTIEKTYAEPTATGTVAEGYIDIGGERFSYRETDWDTDTERAANLAANKGAGEFDVPAVAEWIADLDVAGFDLDLTMFDEDERAALTPDVEDVPAEPDPAQDDVPELPPEPTARPGDIWQLGAHRLMCGDSTNVQHIDNLTNGQEPDMVYTDPPYGMRLDPDFTGAKGNDNFGRNVKGLSGGNKYGRVIGDNEDFCVELISIIFGRFGGCGEIYLWGCDYYAEHIPNRNDGSWIVWDKRLGESSDKMFGSCFELCWSKTRHKRDVARIKWAGVFGTEKEHDKKRHHPTQKPVALAEWFFERWGKPGDVVVDLYGGSGSTLLACEKQGRICHMMEIDAAYCDTIIKRWEKLTGQTAALLGSGGAGEDHGGPDTEG